MQCLVANPFCTGTVTIGAAANGISASISFPPNSIFTASNIDSLPCGAKTAPALPTCSPTLGSCSPTSCQLPYCGPNSTFVYGSCSCVYNQGNPSPILIDTDGSGFHLTSATDGVLFDFYGDGKPLQISWTAPGSTNGWLALDRNGNGRIDNATELFGNITAQPPSNDPNGFLALGVFDQPANGGNGDGILDSRDAVWSRLLVWIDANHDGVSEPAELHQLDEMGIHSIALKYVETPFTDAYGNRFRYQGSLSPDKGDNVDRVIYDVFLTYVHDPATSPTARQDVKVDSHSFASLLANSGSR